MIRLWTNLMMNPLVAPCRDSTLYFLGPGRFIIDSPRIVNWLCLSRWMSVYLPLLMFTAYCFLFLCGFIMNTTPPRSVLRRHLHFVWFVLCIVKDDLFRMLRCKQETFQNYTENNRLWPRSSGPPIRTLLVQRCIAPWSACRSVLEQESVPIGWKAADMAATSIRLGRWDC